MRVLFLHNNYPAQFRHLAAALAARRGVDVTYGTSAFGRDLPGVRRVMYTAVEPKQLDTHLLTLPFEAASRTGHAVLAAFQPLAARGYRPDVICAHSGFGPALYIKHLFPDAKLVGYFEWFYRSTAPLIDFSPHEPTAELDQLQLAGMNAPVLSELFDADAGICPTTWQASQFPSELRRKLHVIHDGIDTQNLRPDPAARWQHGDLVFQHGDRVVTYVSRGLEPHRGFPEFIAAAMQLLAQDRFAHVVVVGADRVFYGHPLPPGETWLSRMRQRYDLSHPRLHIVGTLPFSSYTSLLQVSAVHVYLTSPFVLSWSMLEAMASGCALVASDTPPVVEFIKPGENGDLVDFFDTNALVAAIRENLDSTERREKHGRNARMTIQRLCDLTPRINQQIEFLESV